MSTPIRLAHFSDSHLGFERYPARDSGGRNQRGADVAKAFLDAIAGIVDDDPALVLHSGDLFHASHVDDNNYGVVARTGFTRLATPRADGTIRQTVVIGGNHDTPRHRNEVSPLEFWRHVPGLHVVTAKPTLVTFDPDRDGCAAELADVVIWAVPHDCLRHADQLEDVRPVPGKTNILMTHGVAEGSELFERSIGREFPIPSGLLGDAWDYVALGHYHGQGPVTLGKFGTDQKATDSKIWYAGSTEITSFGDFAGAVCRDRGWLAVTVESGCDPAVRPVKYAIRPHLRLPAVDATGRTPEELTEALIEAVRIVESDDAVVTQTAAGVTREQWGLVDVAAVRAAAAGALHYQVAPRYTTAARAAGGDDSNDLAGGGAAASVLTLLEAAAGEVCNPAYASEALEMAKSLLADSLELDPNAAVISDDDVADVVDGIETPAA